MNRVRQITQLVGLATLCVMAPMHPGSATAQTKPCPAVPDSNFCLTRVSLISKGSRIFKFAAASTYSCKSGSTTRIPTTINADLTASGSCAQEPLFATTLRLVATGVTRLRSDGLGEFFGTFSIGPPSATGSGVAAVYVSGCLEILERVGSHHALPAISVTAPQCEPCDKNPHSEGWIMGYGAGRFAGGYLRAALVANNAPPVAPAVTATFNPTVDGVWMRKP
jgi:hypothetical protein